MPSLAGRAHRLTAVAAAAACWLVVPAGASAEQGSGLDVSGLTSAATGAVAATGSAVEDTVTAAAPLAGPAQGTVTELAGTVAQVTGPKGPVARTADATGSVVKRVTRPAVPVAGAADRVVSRARSTVDETLGGATDEALHGAAGAARRALRDSGTAGAVAGQGSPRVERLAGPGAGRETARPARLTLRGTAAPDRFDAPLPGKPASPILTPLIPGPPIGVPGIPAGGGDSGSSAGAGALELPSDAAPVSGSAGGSSAAGASVSFFLGGLALLLATLSLAGPALRRRLPRRPVIAWPAAFVPLLERPG